jgi:CheY-like chemotaxis protein
VQDTGQGMSPEVQTRVFEPFFSTKGPQQASGMGLALAFGIVDQHHGWIECSSQSGRGSCFEIYLPRYSQVVVAPPVPAVPLTKSQRNSTTTILLVDDERMIRELGRAILEGLGYQVLLAEDGVEAVDIFQRERHLIDLVILDLTMPRLSGNDACRRMLEIDPGVRVLFSSGYFAEDLTAGEDRIVGFLHKPYRQDELGKAVRAALEQAGVPKRDVLLMLVKRLEQALDGDWVGRERAWLERVIAVLDRVDQVMRQHAFEVEAPDGPWEGAEWTPTGSRRSKELHAKYADLLERAKSLKSELQRMLLALTGITGTPAEKSGPPPAVEGPVALDIGKVRPRLEQFRKDLENHRQEEINVVLESVTTDIGGGD